MGICQSREAVGEEAVQKGRPERQAKKRVRAEGRASEADGAPASEFSNFSAFPKTSPCQKPELWASAARPSPVCIHTKCTLCPRWTQPYTHITYTHTQPSPGSQRELFVMCQVPFRLHFKSKSQMERMATICSPGITGLE